MHRLMTLAALFFSLSAAAAEPGEPLLLTAPILEEGGEAFVNINNSHRTAGGELYVNINNSH